VFKIKIVQIGISGKKEIIFEKKPTVDELVNRLNNQRHYEPVYFMSIIPTGRKLVKSFPEININGNYWLYSAYKPITQKEKFINNEELMIIPIVRC